MEAIRIKTWFSSLATGFKILKGFFTTDPFPLFSVLLGLLFCDQILKKISFLLRLQTDSFLGFSLVLRPNEDFILSLELTQDHFFNTVIITPVFTWIVFFYFLSVYYIPKNMKFIRWGWTGIAAGALSNIIDKLRTGHVLDIFSFQLDTFHLYFNVADMVQLAGWIVVIAGLVMYRYQIRKIPERRKTFIVMKEQWHFLFSIMWLAFCFGLLFFILNSQFLTQYARTPEGIREKFLLFAFEYFAVVMALFLLPVLAAFVYLSNKIYGPVYAFERYIRSLLRQENPKDLRLRENDRLKRLETLAKEVKEHLQEK